MLAAALPLVAFQLVALMLLAFGGEALDAIAGAGAEPSVLPRWSTFWSQSAAEATAPLLVASFILWRWPAGRKYLAALAVADLVLAAPHALRVGPPLGDAHAVFAGLARPGASHFEVLLVCVSPTLGAEVLTTAQEPSPWNKAATDRLWGAIETQACDGLAAPVAYSAALRTPLADALTEGLAQHRPAAARALGCQLMVDNAPPKDDGAERLSWQEVPELRVDPSLERFWLMRVRGPMPPVFVQTSAQLAGSARAVLSAIARARTAEEVTAIVDDPLGRLAGRALPRGGEVAVADFSWPRRDEARVVLRGRGGAVVGLRTAFAVGWHAEQSGRSLPVVRVAGAQVAAVVSDASAGPVELRYAWPHADAGRAAAALGVVLAAGLVIVPARRSRRPQTSG
jgi:hypothetical protein